MPAATRKLYLDDSDCFESPAQLLAIADGKLAFDQTCFYSGGGGQPSDTGTITLPSGETLSVAGVAADDEGVLWHTVAELLPGLTPGQTVQLSIDRARRLALTRYHTVLHVLNTIALNDYGAWITGVQIGVDYSRIDFKFENFTPAVCPEIEAKVNAVLDGARPLRAYTISEDEFRNRPDLLRTLEVKPPVINGRVRVVEIEGFDSQACGGTHVHSTAQVGRFSIYKTENKGKINKRLYVRLSEAIY